MKKYFEGGVFKKITGEDPLRWDNPNITGSETEEILRFFGWSTTPVFSIGSFLSFPIFVAYEWSISQETPHDFEYYGALYLGDRGEDIFFKTQLDLLDFLNAYAAAFNLYIQNESLNVEMRKYCEPEE